MCLVVLNLPEATDIGKVINEAMKAIEAEIRSSPMFTRAAENVAERVGFEITCKRITNNLEGSGRQFY